MEKNFENKIKKFLKENNCWLVKYWGGGYFTTSGIPDLLVCVNGRFIGIEVKDNKGRPTLLQLRQLELINKANGYGILLYPQDWEDFKKFIVGENNDWYNENLALQKEWRDKLDT